MVPEALPDAWNPFCNWSSQCLCWRSIWTCSNQVSKVCIYWTKSKFTCNLHPSVVYLKMFWFPHITRYDTLVMVSGGSGITPFISIIRELMYLNTAFRCRTPKVILSCAFKNSSYLSMLDLILPDSGTPCDISNMKLQIEAYITTRKEEHILESALHLKHIRFKPKPTDAPISAILGPNSWLWLCAIISSSFIIFLILIGIITRYIIFPVDHNSNKIFSQSLGSFLCMLATCVSIAMAASVAVLWNKKHNDKEAKQMQNLEGSSAAAELPKLRVDGGDEELESLPHQTLVQAIKVHFGVRPDLRSKSFTYIYFFFTWLRTQFSTFHKQEDHNHFKNARTKTKSDQMT